MTAADEHQRTCGEVRARSRRGLALALALGCGASLASARAGELSPPSSFRGVWQHGATRGHSPGLAPDAVFWIGSLSKQFAAAAALRLAERGRLDLERPIAELVPGLEPGRLRRGGEVCTVARLLRHTCALPIELPAIPCVLGHLEDPARRACFIRAINRVGVDDVPGARFRYSNVGYDLLGLVLAEASGLPYEQLLRRELWQPLDMHDTDVTLPEGRAARLARGEMVLFGLPLDAAAWHLLTVGAPARFGASGNVHSTVPDLIRWTEALHGGQVLSPTSYRRMITPGEGDYGDGIIASERPFGSILWHSGSLSPYGYNSFAGWHVDTGEAIVVLANRPPAVSHSGRWAEALLGGAPPREPTIVEQLQAALAPAMLLFGLPILALSAVRRVARAATYPRLEWLLAHHTLLAALQLLVVRFREPEVVWLTSAGLAGLALLGFFVALPALARAPWMAAERPRGRQGLSLAVTAAIAVGLIVVAPPALGWTQAALLALEALALRRRRG